ncbi:MAG: thioredoxin [Anaerotruncus sp.]|nr:thioredoxin [Anaerotruncus sp.]
MVHFNKQTFDAQVTHGTGLALVDFFATWCGPCTMFAPVLEQLASEVEGKALVGKVDIDAEPEIANAHDIQAYPTLLLFRDGKEIRRFVGIQPKQVLLRVLEEA